MKKLEKEELLNITGGCNFVMHILDKYIYMAKYLKVVYLVHKVFE